jgi:Leucine-rich repeat (LRR) protein
MTDMNFFEVSENAFTDKLPTQLDLMVKLEKFHIHQAGGGLTGTLPAFNNFPLLTELSLDNNKFSGPIPPTFLQGISDTAKQSAHILASLTHNDLTDVVPKELSNFADLDIRLEGNKISGIAPELCEKGEWMNGQVEKLGNSCDAILCPANTFNVYGKKSVGEFSECADCPSAQFYGSVFCDDDNPNPEKTILDKLYKATGGRYWKRSANWTEPGVPICFREGIICDGETDAGVIEIEMLDNELNGVIPADVFDLPKVRLLGFTNNDVDISFSKIADASALIVLKMSNTKVRSLDGIDKAPAALTEMHLAGNQLAGSIPSAVYKLNTVEKLFLNNNLFTGSITDKVKDMTNLQQLYLGGNKLTGHIPPELGSLQKLEQIDLEANFLSGNLPTELEQLPLLINLLLRGQKSDKKLSGSLLSFTGSDRISTIDLSNNDFAGTIPNDFLSNVPSERAVTVNLASNRISGTLPIALKALSSLNIDLANNEVVRLFDDSCDVNPAWMDGAIAAFPTCDAILCGPGTHAPKGKQVSAAEPCVQCPDNLVDAPFFGATSCKSHINGFTEQNVLEELYARTNGTNWITRTNWVSDKSVCSWYGVTCRDDGVTELKLDSNGLETSDDVSSLIFSLPNLEKLDIKGKSFCDQRKMTISLYYANPHNLQVTRSHWILPSSRMATSSKS